MSNTIKQTTTRIESGSAMSAGGHAYDAIQGRVAMSGAVLGGLGVRDRDAAACIDRSSTTPTFPGLLAWRPPTG